MQEITQFVAEDAAARQIYLGAAALYECITQDQSDTRLESDVLAEFFADRP